MKLSVFFPSKDKNGNRLFDCTQRALLEGYLIDNFGGFTAIQGSGCWQDDFHKVHKENVTVYECYTSRNLNAWGNFNPLEQVLRKIGQRLNQASVAYTVDNEIRFVSIPGIPEHLKSVGCVDNKEVSE